MGLKLSRFVFGYWRAKQWNYNTREHESFIQQILDLGITSFDHADIYGGFECENIFGEVLKSNPTLRKKMEIVTKCGIKFPNEKFPAYNIHSYDTSKNHIINSAENSLKNLRTEYLDLLLIHRSDPIMNADEVAEAFFELKKSGKVLHFGVSNFLPQQFSLLQSRLDFPLATNQIEVSVLNTEHFDNGNIDFLQEKRIRPMVWSPFAGGRLFVEENEQAHRVRNVLYEIANRFNTGIDSVAAAWLLMHPVNFSVVLGSGKIERIKFAMRATEINLTREDWFKIWVASKGHDIP